MILALRKEVKVGLIVLVIASSAWVGFELSQVILRHESAQDKRISAIEARPSELKVSVVTPSASPSATPTKAVKRVTTAPTISK